MSFPSKSGCPFCSIVARASSPSAPHSPSVTSLSPSSSTFATAVGGRASLRSPRAGKAKEKEPDILWHDENFTVYREHAHPVSSIAHLVIIFNLHVPSLYMLSTSDVPLLVHLRELAHRFLADLSFSGRLPSSPSLLPPSPISPASPFSLASSPPAERMETNQNGVDVSQFRVGFITPPWKDPSIPVKHHLHAHAFVAPMDRCSWWRSVAYSPLAWYAVEDLIAEIREENSNNRIRSSSVPSSNPDSDTYTGSRPIDRIPNAGARSGTADGHETTRGSLAGLTDLESGRRSSRSSTGSGSAYGYNYNYQPYRRNGEGSGGSKSPLNPPFAVRLAAPSHLDLDAPYSGSSSSPGAGPSTPTKKSSSTSSSPASAGEPRPGSSIAPTGQLLSPSYCP